MGEEKTVSRKEIQILDGAVHLLEDIQERYDNYWTASSPHDVAAYARVSEVARCAAEDITHLIIVLKVYLGNEFAAESLARSSGTIVV